MTDQARVIILDEQREQAHYVNRPPTPAELAKQLARLGNRPGLSVVNGHQGAAPVVWAVDEMQQFYAAPAVWPDEADEIIAELLKRGPKAGGLRFRGLNE